jgi:hypothetical protein
LNWKPAESPIFTLEAGIVAHTPAEGTDNIGDKTFPFWYMSSWVPIIGNVVGSANNAKIQENPNGSAFNS